MNFAFRTECHRCNQPRPSYFAGSSPEKTNGKSPVEGNEIQEGLQLCVVYKKVPAFVDSKNALNGLHSSIPSTDGAAHILLFTSIEALENAKLKLDADTNVKSTNYMGVRSAEIQVNYSIQFVELIL
jgi:hypothetical protein